jgi:hypothetical protein
MLKRGFLLTIIASIALAIGAVTVPAEAQQRDGYSNADLYFEYRYGPRYRRPPPPRYRYRRPPPSYYYYDRRPPTRYERYCRRVERWVRSQTSDPKMQARLLRQHGC